MSATNGSKTTRASFLRSAMVLSGSVLLVALLIAPFAAVRSGSGGLGGLALAAAICLLAGWAAESLSCVLQNRVAPLAMMLLGMTLRMCRHWAFAWRWQLKGLAAASIWPSSFICWRFIW